MATPSLEKKALLLGLLIVALAATASCGPSGRSAAPTVTINNPTKMIVSVLVSDRLIQVVTDMMTILLDFLEQDVQIQNSEGRVTVLHVKDGDVLQLVPDPDDPRNFHVQVVITNPAVKPSVTSGIRAPPSPNR